ncbi:MAG: glycosyltransferase family 2 protein [Oscillospiraceae bacterium]
MSKISVIVPVYNARNTIDICVKSIISQDFNDLEILLVDDGSTDSSGEICDAWAEKDSRIKVVHQKNSGSSAARNTGIKMAQGKWISFIDSDDVVSKNFFSELIDAVNNTNAEIVLTKYKVFEDDKNTDFTGENYTDKKVFSRNKIAELCFRTDYHGYCWNKLFKRDIIINNNIFFDSRLALCEDMHFLINYIQHINEGAVQNGKLYFYRKPSGSCSWEKMSTAIAAYNKILKFPMIQSSPELTKYASINLVCHCLRTARLKIKTDPDIKEYHSESKKYWNLVLTDKNTSVKTKTGILILRFFPKLLKYM